MKLHGHDIEVGDKVWHRDFGYCRIVKIEGENIPYYVKFERDISALWVSEKSLFWQPFDIPSHAYQKPKKLVEKGYVVYKIPSGKFECTSSKYTKSYFEALLPRYQFIRFVEETVDMVEE